MTLPLLIFGLLLISLTGAQEPFPNNFVVAKRNDANVVTLTCDTKTEGPITWKFHGESVEDVVLDSETLQVGQNLAMVDVGRPMLGQYSCWSGGKMVSSTYLLLEEEVEEEEEEDELDSPLHCRAKSYDCTFSCTWTKNESLAVRMGLGSECREGEKSCQWFSNSVRLQNGGFRLELSHHLSPYSEESTMLEITAEAIVDLSLVRRTKRFYLRDIVQPDRPKIVKCQEVGEDLNVTIEPPSSWSTPHSFFRLEHQIEYELRDDGQIGRSLSNLVPKRISKLRVRSQDPLVLSHWSQWTSWRNVTASEKKRHKCRNTAKSCRQEVPSKSLKGCEKNGKKKRKKDGLQSQTS